jgi:hypothetical protein
MYAEKGIEIPNYRSKKHHEESSHFWLDPDLGSLTAL